MDIMIKLTVEGWAGALSQLSCGRRLWGGGAGVGRTPRGTFKLDCGPDEYGGKRPSRYFRRAEDALWAYLKEVGSVYVSVE